MDDGKTVYVNKGLFAWNDLISSTIDSAKRNDASFYILQPSIEKGFVKPIWVKVPLEDLAYVQIK